MSESHEYSNGEITIVWQPKMCSHSGRCVSGLPQVFDLKLRPWVQPQNASTEDLIRQVDACPSGALSWRRDEIASDEV